jgi:hypothetical protein
MCTAQPAMAQEAGGSGPELDTSSASGGQWVLVQISSTPQSEPVRLYSAGVSIGPT